MHRDPRPDNVCHIRVDASIDLSALSPAFRDNLSMYTLSYYLPFRNLSDRRICPSKKKKSNGTIFPPSAPSFNAADALDADIFSPSSGGKNSKPVSYLEQDSQPTSINQQFDKESTEPGTDKEGDGSDEGTSNDGMSPMIVDIFL